jgi:hypothetical protein
MVYQPRKKSARDTGYGYGRVLREKSKDKKRLRKRLGRQFEEEKHILTEQEAAEITLKRLHTLGSQKFGASPFSEYFNRWLANVEAVLDEFKSHSSIGSDEQFMHECSETLSTIKRQLENRKRSEELVNEETEELEKYNAQLQKIKLEYEAKMLAVKVRKRKEIKRLSSVIDQLKKEQDTVIRMKTGFFHLTSKKKREQKETEVMQKLNDRQTELELIMLDFSAEQNELRDDYDIKKEPVLKIIKNLQKTVGYMETDSSLEERWFACEALIDAMNSFLQRKAAQPH